MDKWLLKTEASIPVTPPGPKEIPDGSTIHSFSIVQPGPDPEINRVKLIPQKAHIKGSPEALSEVDRGRLYDVEVIVEADTLQMAIDKSLALADKTLDLLSFLIQRPCYVTRCREIANLSRRRAADAGEQVQEEIGSFGEMSLLDHPFPPVELLTLPDNEQVARALTWFRKGIAVNSAEDRFLSFYIALELVSPVIRADEVSTHRCPHCGEDTKIPKVRREGILFIITDVLGKKASLYNRLAKARAKIVHGDRSKPSDPRAAPEELGPLTEVVIAALKHVLRLGQEGLPLPRPFEVDPERVVLYVAFHRARAESSADG